MTLFELLEEIKIRKKGTYDDFSKSTNELADRNKKTLKSISNKVNEKLKEIYHPEFLKKIYRKLQHVYVFKHNNKYIEALGRAYMVDSSLYSPINKIVLKLLHFEINKRKKNLPEDISKKSKSELQKRGRYGRTFSLDLSYLKTINSNEFIVIVLHELQHIFEDSKYNFTEFGTLKRKLFIFFKKYVKKEKLLKKFKEEINEILTELTSIFMGRIPSYKFWLDTLTSILYHVKMNKQQKIIDFLKELREVLKENKIYNPVIIDKKITLENLTKNYSINFKTRTFN